MGYVILRSRRPSSISAAYAHLVRVPIEPRLHGLKEFVRPSLDSPLFTRCALALQCAGLTGGGPIAEAR